MKKNITIDDLARMVKEGFDDTGERIGGVEERIGGVEERIGGVEERIGGVEKMVKDGFAKMNERFNKIEKILIADHQQRIERLEEEIKYLKELFAVK